jgi:hypothetical protein
MSEIAEENAGPPIGTLHEVRATFTDPDAMQDAVARLETSGFDRADLSLPEAMPPIEGTTPESGAKPVDTEEDARQARTLHTSGAAAAVGGWGCHCHRRRRGTRGSCRSRGWWGCRRHRLRADQCI